MPLYDYLIQGGRVIDPANGVDMIADVAIKDGRIAALASDIDMHRAVDFYDATGQIVTPGLIDLHTHVYEYATPLGINPDEHCLRRGVTTVVDAGSAGYLTLPGFRRYIVDRAKTRVLAFVNVSSIGLASAGLGGQNRLPGELESLAFVSVNDTADAIEKNRDLVVGVKLRLSDTVANNGRFEADAFSLALELTQQVQLPLMVHHTFSTIPLTDCPGRLQSGDIYTHTYHGFPSTIVDLETRRVAPSVWEAYRRGVTFDVGSGQGSFNWTVAEMAINEGFLPHTISTDLHVGNINGPTYDIATVMTRLLHLGVPLQTVIEAATITPARLIGWEDRIGTLDVGRTADVTALSIAQVDMNLEDCQSQTRRIKRRIHARSVWREGVYYPCTSPNPWPNPKTIERQSRSWSKLLVRDAEPPYTK